MIKLDVVKQPNFTELAKQMPPTQQDMHRLAGDAADIIKKRTQEGRSVKGSQFVRYSKPYRDYKIKVNKFVGYPNLSLHGDMMGTSMQTRGISNPLAGEIFIVGDRAAVAQIHNEGLGEMPEREFFGLSDAELKKLTDALAIALKTRLERIK